MLNFQRYRIQKGVKQPKWPSRVTQGHWYFVPSCPGGVRGEASAT